MPSNKLIIKTVAVVLAQATIARDISQGVLIIVK